MNEIKIKIVLVGNTEVGKTAFAIRCQNGTFDQNTQSTITYNYYTKKVNYDGQAYQLEIWDTAGQERFSDIGPLTYRGADIVLMMFSCDDLNTLEGLGHWESNVLTVLDKDTTIFCVVATKIDILTEKGEGEEKENSILEQAKNKFPDIDSSRFFIISSKTDFGIDDMIYCLVQSYFDAKYRNNKSDGVDISDNSNSKRCC